MSEVMVKQPQVYVGAVVVHYGNALLVKRDDPMTAGRWSIPCSRLQWGETLPHSVEREVKAATGITIQAGAVIHAYDMMLPPSAQQEAEHRVIIEIEADYLGGELSCGETVNDVAWVSALALSTMEVDETTLALLTELGFIHAE